ncbi:MAG TPA: proline--tRNA ligase [Egibacteraceae bacterium]|nr:proline--tRNA ligase [Egibacteraceae bacterium]
MANPKRVLTPQSEDFPRWYQDVVAKAEMAENGPARGTMIIKPWGYAIWERIQAEMDARIKATGHVNAYFPMFIPTSFLQREAEHVEGFSPELAVVTHAGGEELAEPLVVRPTSETVIGDAMSRWIQGYRDLPLLLNQWANVVRWELRPRLFLRTTEFLWQEGHTAHAAWDEAQEETLKILFQVYEDVIRNVLAVPVVLGRKTDREKFAGAEVTYTLEGLMRDGKALQMGTSHNMGTNFAKAFGIQYTDAEGKVQFCNTTSWGVSTRVVGGLVMSHGDDDGLRLPPEVAPVQVVVLAVKEETIGDAERLAAELNGAGIRAKVDDRINQSFGRRAVEWELKGAPVRIEVGPRDLANGEVTVVRRDEDDKHTVALDLVATQVPELLAHIQESLLEDALRRRDEFTRDVDKGDEIDGAGFFRIPWDALGEDGEAALAERGYSVRCLVKEDGSVPAPHDDRNLVAYCAKAY